MDDVQGNQELQVFLQSKTAPAATEAELNRLDQHARAHPRLKGKIRELGIFTVGIGIILAALTLWLSYALQPPAGQPRSMVLLVVPLSISALYIVLGALTLKVRSRAVIQATVVVVVCGFLVDLLLGFNLIKAAIAAAVIWLIVKTGREALDEVDLARRSLKT